MRKLLVFLLVLGLLSGEAFAAVVVRTTGNVNLREGPGLDYDVLGSISSGMKMEYLEETSTDERGVDWYMVSFQWGEAWISSKYAVLSDEEETPVTYDPNADTIELAGYYLQDLKRSAAAAGLKNYREALSEIPNQYYNNDAVFGGYDSVEYIALCGPGYTVYGVALGMDEEMARQLMLDAGLDYSREVQDWIVFQHRTSEKSPCQSLEHDSCINIRCEDGIVTELDWSTYTG